MWVEKDEGWAKITLRQIDYYLEQAVKHAQELGGRGGGRGMAGWLE